MQMSVNVKLRTIHHLACSGGTVISKAVQAMANTLVISEIHPDELFYRFNPFDPTQLLLAQTKLGNNSHLRRSIFLRRIAECVELADTGGLTLVLRDHTHYDYSARPQVPQYPALLGALSAHYETCSLLTIRNPLEAFISLQKNGWNQAVSDFDDYCQRYETMVSHYQTLNAGLLRYEDFCADPDTFMLRTCELLDLNFNASFRDALQQIPMTGDSGRGRQLGAIQTLSPKPVSRELAQQANQSDAFNRLAERFNYSIA